MKLLASTAAAATVLILMGPALAQTTPPGSGSAKMSQADCTSAWARLDTAKSGSVTQAQAQGVVSDFKSADSNGDGKLTQPEFTSACDKGLVSAAAGTGTGSRGMTGTDTKPSGATK